MKTQIISLASHDDLVSVRDRMSWAKSPRILLVWPPREDVALRPLDLRILQQHAGMLGAQLGIVTRHRGVRREAESFGIPVFRAAAEAQRERWPGDPNRSWRRRRQLMRDRMPQLRAMKQQIRQAPLDGSPRTGVRIGVFGAAVIAVLGLASLFAARATVVLTPISMEQAARVEVELNSSTAPGVVTGGVPAHRAEFAASGNQSIRVKSQAQVPKEAARGTARFENLTPSPLVIPAGTVVFSTTPVAVRFVTLEEAQLEGQVNALVDIPIAALEAGKIGNLPANAIQGIEGALGASTVVTNPSATSGGADELQNVPSQADRDELRTSLLEDLRATAESEIPTLIEAEDVILPGTLSLVSVDEEIFDPGPGQPASVLSLSMRATYQATYVLGEDLRRLAEVTLNASMPPEYIPSPGTLTYRVKTAPTPSDDSGSRFELEIERTIRRAIDAQAASQLIRGRSPKQAREVLQSSMPLASPPEIRLSPPWWPWVPLIPFRIDMVIG